MDTASHEMLNLLKTRRSVRAYKADPVPEELLDQVLEAGTYAPSAMGRQSPTLIAVTSPKYREQISKLNAAVMGTDKDPYYGAPVIVLALADPAIGPWVEDASCALENMLMMVCAGASEQAVSQWASTFAEKGLGVSKALGDLTGPTVFSLLMGLSRLIYGKRGDKMDLTKTMLGCCGLCVAAYLLIGLTQSPLTGLIGVGLCGFSVGIFWPGTFSTASASMHRGGTALFALMALAGDLGCSAGPTVAGAVASALGDNLRAGILCGLGFPLLMIVGVLLMKRMADRAKPRA